MSRPRPVPSVYVEPEPAPTERNQDSRLAAAYNFAERIVHKERIDAKWNNSSGESLLAQALLDLRARHKQLERRLKQVEQG